MGKLTREEIRQIRKSLEESGLTYAQLQDELLDHLVCEIEAYMEQGVNFQQAWQKVNTDIPKNQFKNIQTETMEILNKKISVIKIMTLVSFFLLVSATIFKLLHWTGSDMLLLSAFGMGALTILKAALKGFYISPNKKGRYLVLLIGLLTVIFITSLVFKLLSWPGGVQLMSTSVIGLILLFPAISIYFFRKKQAAQDHPLILLTEANQALIERIVLALVALGIIFKLPVLLQTSPYNFAPTLFLILAIFIAGLHIFTLTWKPYVTSLSEKKERELKYLLIFSILAFILFMTPAINGMLIFPEIVEFVLPLSFYIILAGMVAVYYLNYAQGNQRQLLALFSFLILLIPALRLSMETGLLSENIAALISDSIYNLGVLTVLITLLVIFYKKTVFRYFILLMLAHYVLTYPVV